MQVVSIESEGMLEDRPGNIGKARWLRVPLLINKKEDAILAQ